MYNILVFINKGAITLIQLYTTMGKVSMTNEYIQGIVSIATQSCYGVCGMVTSSSTESIKSFIVGPRYPDKGLQVSEEDGLLCIELHIKVTYGLNISAIVRSITHKVKYALEDATGVKVKRVNVYVDDIVS